MSELLHVSSAPHVRAKTSTTRVMFCVILAMLPSMIFGIVNFGIRALLLVVATVLSCLISETVYNLIAKKKNTIGDLSAVVTGMILALNMPVTLPIWEAVLGGMFAIVVVKMLFGGLGQNFMNPALAARCFLLIAFVSDMTNFNMTSKNFLGTMYTGATPLVSIKETQGMMTPWSAYKLEDLFFGFTPGTIGETSVLCLLIGAAILLITKTISLRIPVAYLGTFAIFTLLFGQNSIFVGTSSIFTANGLDMTQILISVLAQLMSGGLIFGAFFMATDYATTPITKKGQILFGISCGLLTGIFRFYGASAEGVSYAIILSNLFVPLIEKITIPRAFGLPKKNHKKEGN